MSQSIWTQCGGPSSARAISGRGWRLVESQFVNSTRKLVDSDEEQALLESLLDTVKPQVPPDVARLKLHYLFFTPFRHPPLRNGSRFGVRQERGIFYGSVALATAMSEVAYYRLVFLSGTRAELGLLETPLTAFRFRVKSRAGVELTLEPFAKFEAEISSPTDYAASQALGRELREAGIEAVRFVSARAPDGGVNWALFTPCFAAKSPERDLQEWHCSASVSRVEFRRKNPLALTRELHAFAREDFLVRGKLPSPAV